MKKLNIIFLTSLVVLLFTACGGGGGGGGDTKISLSNDYTVVDPYIQGATFYWDKNDNNVHDSGEPVSNPSNANGKFSFNVNVPLGQKIVMLTKGEHNGVSYTGELTSLITTNKVVSPLTTLEERYFRGKKAELVKLLNDNALNISEDDIHKDPMASNNIEHLISNLAVDAYLKIDKFRNVDKNGTELADSIALVKDLIELDNSKANIEDTVSIMDYVTNKIKEDGDLSELNSLKESFANKQQLKNLLKNRTDKTVPGRISYIGGQLTAKKAKKDQNKLKDLIISFDKRAIKDELLTLSINIETISGDVVWSIIKQPDGSDVNLSVNEDKKSVNFTPTHKGAHRILFEMEDTNSISKKVVEFSVEEDIAIDVNKVKGFESDKDSKELLGEVTNQSWVSSFIHDEAALTTIVNKYAGFTILGYNKMYGLLIGYDDTDATVQDNLASLKYEFGISRIYNRVFEGEDAFKQAAIYPNDNGAFNDGGANWHLESINMPDAWEYSKGDDSFLVGVCDGGYDNNHQDLSGRFASILNYGKSGANGDHGMAVTGAIGANTNNGIGISGINWNAKFVTSYMGTKYVRDVVETKQDGKEVNLVSNSWGIHIPSYFNPTDSRMASERFNYLQRVFAERNFLVEAKQDKLFLWAAGNGVGNGRSSSGYYGVDSKYDNGAMHYTNGVLNKHDNVLVVAAFKNSSSGYVLTYYSNFGESVDIAAPTEFDSLKLNNGIYTRFGGTSAATPVVSGVASLIMTINPNLTPKQVKKILIDSATDNITHRYVNPYTSQLEQLARPIPILNAKEALKMAKETIDPEDDGEGNPKIAIDFMAELTDNFAPKATFSYYTFDKNYRIVNVNSTVKSSSNGTSYSAFGTKSIDNDVIEVTLDPNNRLHEITSVLTLKHLLTGETQTQTHIQKFTYADMILKTKYAQDLEPLPNTDFKIFSSSIFKKFQIEGTTDGTGTRKIYLPYNMYNILGTKDGFKDAGAQSMIFEDKTYNVDLLFGLAGTDPAGSVSGLVTDEQGNPIEGAKVEIFNVDSSIKSVLTDANGNYQLSNISKKDGSGALITNFVIKVTKSTYSDAKREHIIIIDGKDVQENFVLIKVSDNQPPIAVAGPDQVVTVGDTVTFTSTGSTDVDGSIVRYEWREGDTVLSTQATFDKSDLTVGTHTITLIVEDDDGAIGADTVVIIVNELLVYNWVPDAWGACTGLCGVNNGEQTRTVNCKDNSGNIVSDNLCVQVKPPVTQSCTASLCNNDYNWKIGEWGTCQGDCGISNGTQTRDIICQDKFNFSVDESLCTDPKPISSQTCETAKCSFDFGTIISPVTGRTWIDRNIGSPKVCSSLNDSSCFGDYFQWGREDDGHQLKDSTTTTTISSTIKPNNSNFITFNLAVSKDWTSADSSGVDRATFWNRSDGFGICPKGYRVPTIEELKAENMGNAEEAFIKLKLPQAGIRKYSNGEFDMRSSYVWSNTTEVTSTKHMQYTTGDGNVEVSGIRGFAMPVRCINDVQDSNNPPIARIEADKVVIIEGETIKFSAKTSTDSDGFIASYEWKNGDSVLSISEEFSTWTLAVGTHTIALKVTDNKGATDTASITITVNEKPEFSWFSEPWGACSGPCGKDNGTQSRVVVCKDKSGATVDNGQCTIAMPATSQNCTASYCDMDYGTVESPVTGRIWLDRNLGAVKVCASINEAECYGDYYQWGRSKDGHEDINSNAVGNISVNLVPSHPYFIQSSVIYDFDWTIDDNAGVQRIQKLKDISGAGICPVGYRVPTKEELIAENLTNSSKGFTNLKLPINGYRKYDNSKVDINTNGYLLSTSISNDKVSILKLQSNDDGTVKIVEKEYANGFGIRCIKAQDNEISENKPPIANAGADIVITEGETAVIDGSQSYDPDGIIVSYKWEKDNLTIYNIKNFNLIGLTAGTHVLKLTVTDNDGATSTDEIIIVVNPQLSHNWSSGSWGACTGDCGNNMGTQTRTVVCKDNSNNTVADNLCTATKPATSQVCTAKQCVSYEEIISPVTGRIWMDRNVGAKKVCSSHNDELCYGDYYQWGRAIDGHEKTDSGTTTTLSSNIVVGSNQFILSTVNDDYDWLNNDADGTTRNASWIKTDGTSICPTGFRVPTADELNAEGIDSVSKAFNNLKLPLAGLRDYETGNVNDKGLTGGLWSSTPNGTNSMYLHYGQGNDWSYYSRASGRSIRCIKD